MAEKKRGSSTVASIEFIRGLASLDVFVWHVLNTQVSFFHIPGLYRAVAWSRESVIVFFVLSGYVISLSQHRLHRTAGPFMLARIKRIVPIYWVALAAAVVTGIVLNMPCTPWQLFGHLVFLQSFEGSLVSPLPTNGPLWSLGTEFEFYLLLGVSLLLRWRALLVVWWCCAIVGMLLRHAGHFGSGAEGLLLEFLGLSPCWLLGYFVAGIGGRWHVALPQAVALFFMVPMVSFSEFGSVLPPGVEYDDLKCYFWAMLIVPLIHTLAVRQLHPKSIPMANGWIAVAVIYAVVASYTLTHAMTTSLTMYLLAAIPLLACVLALVLQPARFLDGAGFRRVAIFMGGSSYALYAIHTPILFLVLHYVTVPWLQMPLLLLFVGGVVLFLEFVFQPRAAGWIDRLAGSPRRAEK